MNQDMEEHYRMSRADSWASAAPGPPRTDCGERGHEGLHQMGDCTQNLRDDIGKLRSALIGWNSVYANRPLDASVFGDLIVGQYLAGHAMLEETLGIVDDMDYPPPTHTIPTPTTPNFMRH